MILGIRVYGRVYSRQNLMISVYVGLSIATYIYVHPCSPGMQGTLASLAESGFCLFEGKYFI